MATPDKTCEAPSGELINIVNSIIIRWDIKGNFTFLNEFAQKFFGFSENEVLGKNLMGTIVPPSDSFGNDLKTMIDDLLANPGKYINNENENITKDGRHVWISWTNKPILGEDGKVKEILSVGNDISQLKRAEVELERANELAESAGKIGIIICNADWTIRAINGAAKKHFYLEEEARNRDFFEVVLKYYEPSISREQICDVSSLHTSFDLVRPESETNKALYLQVNREIIRTERAVVSIIFSIQDVTDQREEEFLKQDFLSLISHKLRTPITIIEQSARILQQGSLAGLDEKQKQFVNDIVEESFNLNKLINNLLSFVVINHRKISSFKEAIKPAERVPMLVKPILAGTEGKKVDFGFDCPDKDLIVNMDPTYFDLLIRNLVDNAVKFNDKDPMVIKISVKNKDGIVVISVSDNGPGIAVENQEKIFAGFYQPEKFFTGNVAGAGLGLLLVKKIVTANGGTIDLKSEIGQGSTVTLSLTSPDK